MYASAAENLSEGMWEKNILTFVHFLKSTTLFVQRFLFNNLL